MKQCLVIHGSPRNGNTRKVTGMVMAEMMKLGEWEFTEVNVHDLRVPFCVGCYNCFSRGEEYCPHREQVQMIESLITSSDAVILSAPIYILQINGETKNLLDRFAYRFHRPKFFDKKALVITTTAGAGAKKGARFLRETLYQMGFNYAYLLPITCFDLVLKPNAKQEKLIKMTATKFHQDLHSAKLHRPGWFHVIYHTAFRAGANAGKKEDSADYRYWRDNGLLEKKHPTSLGAVKGLAAGMLFALMRQVIPS